MAWIESNQELGRHPKTKRAARILDVSVPAIVGHLHFLWWWCLEYAQDGDLTVFESADIADACGWEGDPDIFIKTLLDCGPGDSIGFIEKTEDGRLIVHDWMDYAGRLVEKREANADRMRKKRAEKSRATHVQRTCNERTGATVPNLTVPNSTVPINNNNAREDIENSKIEETVSEANQVVLDLEKTLLQTEEIHSMAIGTQAIDWAQTNWGRMITPRETDDIIAWCDEFSTRGSPDPDSLVIEGLKQCSNAGVRNMNYLRTVLTDWRENGVLTVDHVTARDTERKTKKNSNRNKGHGDTPPGTPKIQPDKYKNFYL